MRPDTQKTAGQTHDPVCGMVVHPATARNHAEHDKQTYYFCCGGCKAKFMADPGQYLKPTARPTPSTGSAPKSPVAQGTIYTCPMHPQIRRSEPGSCPIWRQTKANKAVNCSRFPRKSDCLVIDRNLREFRGMWSADSIILGIHNRNSWHGNQGEAYKKSAQDLLVSTASRHQNRVMKHIKLPIDLMGPRIQPKSLGGQAMKSSRARRKVKALLSSSAAS